jgi:hypothetical protein
MFTIKIQGEQLSGDQFEQFWNHVPSVLPPKYDEIILFCRAKVPIDSTTTIKLNIIFDYSEINPFRAGGHYSGH